MAGFYGGYMGNEGGVSNALAGLQLPLPGDLNRGGAYRQPGYRPGREVEEIPGRPMRPSDYQGPPAIPTQGTPFASFTNGRSAMGNAAVVGNAGIIASNDVNAKAFADIEALLRQEEETQFQNLFQKQQQRMQQRMPAYRSNSFEEQLPGTVKYVY